MKEKQSKCSVNYISSFCLLHNNLRKENYKLYIRGYSPLCSCLKTKESYDRWVTRRLWGFRQQISKAKYPKMSVGNIRKLQENIVALYTKRKTLLVSDISGSGYVWSEKLKRPPLPSGCEMSADGIPDAKCPAPPGYPDQLHPDSPKRTCGALPYPDSIREKHTTLVNITPGR